MTWAHVGCICALSTSITIVATPVPLPTATERPRNLPAHLLATCLHTYSQLPAHVLR